MKSENFARLFIVVVFLTVLALLVSGIERRSKTLVLTGSMPEEGGWQPGVIRVQAGQPLDLHLTSNDVVHGFAVGQMDDFRVDVLPGKVTKTTLFFTEPGTYTYYCTRWCGPNHWRMRGTIEVTSEPAASEGLDQEPLYLQLGIDIDASHAAEIVPEIRPSALAASPYIDLVPVSYLDQEVLIASSPLELFQRLSHESGLSGVGDAVIWDLVAWLYWRNVNQEELAFTEELFRDNCAACHGINGEGDGVFSGEIEAEYQQGTIPDFTDAVTMLGASSALLQGKIVRGGMGTGMPYWGTIFTNEQTWALVDYLWSIQFEYPIGE